MGKCNHHRSHVTDTRKFIDQHLNGTQYPVTRRRRECKDCGAMWNTYEIMENEYKALVRIREMVREGRDEWGLTKK